MSNNLINEDQTVEFALIVKAVCDEYGFSQADLAQLGHVPILWYPSHFRKIKFVKQIPVKMLVPYELAPKKNADADDPWIRIDFDPNPTLSSFEYGLNEYSVQTNSGKLRFWRSQTYRDFGPLGNIIHFVERKNLKKFYHMLKEWEEVLAHPPIMEPGKLKDIYINSIGFLEKGEAKKEEYKKYNIPCKRGILFSGAPGCGKTMTCKWLRALCSEKKLESRVVTYEDYRNALSRGSVHQLFKLPRGKKGIIFFDDMDVFFQDRTTGNEHLMTFLTELDGIEPTEGAVYIFTSNKIGDELDEAFIRPGRIDLFQIFRPPNKKLRRKFIKDLFHKDILNQIDVDDLVKRTNSTDESEYTFAEIEEIRKLLALDIIDGNEVDLDKTFKLFENHRKDFTQRKSSIGFGKLKDEDDDDDDEFYDDFGDNFNIPGMQED